MKAVELVGEQVLTARTAADLDALHAQTGAPVTARHRWLAAWFAASPAWEPWLLGVFDGDALVAAAVLARRRRGPFTQVVGAGLGPSDESRFAALPGAAGRLTGVVELALRGLPGPWSLRVEQLPAGDPVTAGLLHALPRALLLPGDGLPRVDIEPGAAAPSSRNSRQAETKARNRLAKDGHTVTHRWLSTVADVTAALPDVERVHHERDLDARGSSEHDRPEVLAFYRRVVLQHAAAGLVDLLELRVDGDLAAYVLGFRDGDVLRVWDNRVAPRWRHASTGRLANSLALAHVAASEDYRTLDWMRGEESYKLSSATRVDPAEHLLAWSSSLASAPWALRGTVKRVAGPQLKAAAQRLRR